MNKFFVLVLVALVSNLSEAYYEVAFTKSTTYDKGIPAGWSYSGSGTVAVMTTQPQEPAKSGEEGLGFNFIAATGSNILHTTTAVIPSNEIICDKVFARARVYLQKEYHKQDYFQIVISTNNWTRFEPVGDPILIEEYGRTVDEWAWVERSCKIPGLASSGNDVSVGILVGSAKKSGKNGYFQSLSLQFVASATPQDVCFKVEGVKTESFTPGEAKAIVEARVDEYPTDGNGKVVLSKVKCILDRHGEITTNDMTRVGSTSCWQSERISPAIDAGESLKVAVLTEYTSAINTLGAKDAQGVARECSSWVGAEGTKKGSVWINEFTTNRVELCGTTNRVMLSGWRIELATNATADAICYADLPGQFDFTTNMINGVVGLETRDLVWKDINSNPISVAAFSPVNSSTNYTLRLRNSAGVIEQDELVTLPLAGSFGKTGCAKWSADEKFGYDWTGTATNTSVFTWVNFSSSTFGTVNEGQGFKVPVLATLVVNTYALSSLEHMTLSCATVVATAYGMGNDKSMTTPTNYFAQAVDGVATCVIDGCSVMPEKMVIQLSASAFGWYCEPTMFNVTNDCVTKADMFLTPTIATDDFQGKELQSFWENASNLTWKAVQLSGNGVLQLDTRLTGQGTAVLKCTNSLNPRGRKGISVSFDFMNWVSSTSKSDYFRVEVTTNSNWEGEVVSSLAVKNKRTPPYDQGEWYGYRTVFELPDEFSSADEIWIRLVCDSEGKTSSYTTIDNLRIAFQDVAMPTNLVRSVDEVVSGQSSDFALDVVPQTSDFVSNVTAQLNFTLNGVTTNVPFAFDGATVTNLDGAATAVVSADALKAVMGDLTGLPGRPFLTGDQVSYYAAVNYYSDNGDTNELARYENRYFPDNHRTEIVEGVEHWIVEGTGTDPYKPVATNFTVSGPMLSVVGTPEVTASGVKFLVHAFTNEAVIASITVNINGKNYDLYDDDPTNRVTKVFDELTTGLVGNTPYEFRVTAKDEDGNVLAESKDTITTLPSINAVTITGVATNEVALIVDGEKAGYEVSGTPSGWKPSGTTTWKGGNSPNCEFTATVTPTNAVGAKGASVSTSGFTLAAMPTKVPVMVKGETTVTVNVADDEVLNGNPPDTEYAICVSNETDKVSVTNVCWKTLQEWKDGGPETLSTPVLNLIATNYLFFVTRNEDGLVSANASLATNCVFDISASFNVDPRQATMPFGELASGDVKVSTLFFDPAQSNATGTVWYQLEKSAGVWTDWKKVQTFDLRFKDLSITSLTTGCVWKARAALQEALGKAPVGNFNYRLRAQISDNGSRTAESTFTGTLDFTAPSITGFTGSPANGAVTNTTAYSFEMTVDETDGTRYVWTLDGVSVTNENKVFSGNVAAGFANHALSAFAIDKFGNASDSRSWAWTVNTVAPTADGFGPGSAPVSADPANLAVTNDTGFVFVGASSGNVDRQYRWFLNGAEVAGSGVGGVRLDGNGVEGTNTVWFWVEDVAGNKSANVVTNQWIVDLHSPANLVLRDAQGADVVQTKGVDYGTSDTSFDFYATADDLTAVTYTWTLRKGAASVKNATLAAGKHFTGKDLVDGEYTVNVSAQDAAKNAPVSTNWTWTVDTTAPEITGFTGSPANNAVTNTTAYSFEMTVDETVGTRYVWTLDGVSVTNENAVFSGNVAAGFANHALSASAIDKFGNASAPRNWAWTVNTVAPTADGFGPGSAPVSADPANLTVTNKTGFVFVGASSGNVDRQYRWFLNGAEVAGVMGDSYSADGVEGTNTVWFWVEDVAGNKSASAVTNQWIVDRLPPQNVVIVGEPGNGTVTKNVSYSFSATVDDATACEFYWALNGSWQTQPSATFTGAVGADGTYTVSVYAVDAAGNASETTSQSWTVDTVAPTEPVITGTPAKGSKMTKDDTNYNLTAASEDANTVVYHWKLVGADGKAGEEVMLTNFVGKLDVNSREGDYTAYVYATDVAGNVSTTNSWSWRYDNDTTPPTKPEISSKSGLTDGGATNVLAFSFSASAEDKHVITYHWKLGAAGEEVASTNFVGELDKDSRDGVYTVYVYATDESGNRSETSSLSWTLDRVSPTMPVITGALVDVSQTNSREYDFVAEAEDDLTVIYHWKLGAAGEEVVCTNFVGELDKDSPDGLYTAYVYATDAAGNVSETNSVSWTLDTVPPTVKLETETPDSSVGFNRYHDFEVTVTFSKPVQNFTADSVTVGNGSVTNVTAVTEGLVYTVLIGPADDGNVNVRVKAGAVRDAAGNGNDASKELTRLCDITPPQFKLEMEIPEAFTNENILANWNNEVTVTFSEPVNEELSEQSVTVSNAERKNWEKVTSKACYKFDVVYDKRDIKEGTILISFAAGVVSDAAGNWNEMFDRPITLDMTAPSVPVITGSPVNGASTVDRNYALTASAKDNLTAVSYRWYVNGSDEYVVTNQLCGIAGVGANSVEVEAVDAAGNVQMERAKWSWTVVAGGDDKVDFGGGVSVAINPATGATNSVSFTELHFNPGAVSTFTLSGFNASSANISGLTMWFVVSERLDETPWQEPVDSTASYDTSSRELTVTLPASATQKGGAPYESFFIRGIDNKAAPK